VQNDVIVAPRRTLAAPCTLERDDGTKLRVELGEWPRLSPTTDERGTPRTPRPARAHGERRGAVAARRPGPVLAAALPTPLSALLPRG